MNAVKSCDVFRTVSIMIEAEHKILLAQNWTYCICVDLELIFMEIYMYKYQI